MLEPGIHFRTTIGEAELAHLQRRANQHRRQHRWFPALLTATRQTLYALRAAPVTTIRRLPPRYILHLVIAMIVPLALLLASVPVSTNPAQLVATDTPQLVFSDQSANRTGATLRVQDVRREIQDYRATAATIGDPPLPEDAIPVPVSLTSRSDALVPMVAPATIRADDVVQLRTGPGKAYDVAARYEHGMTIQVLARYNDWLQVRQNSSSPLMWIARDLVEMHPVIFDALPVLNETDIPAPPPPSIATVREGGITLRDGPGTNYVSLTSLSKGTELELIERYGEWLHVQAASRSGWVNASGVDLREGVLERVATADAASLPEANPALVASVVQDQANLRQGPGTTYGQIGTLRSGEQVTLLAQHAEWYQVQTNNGTQGWVFGNLLGIETRIAQRVPYTDNIPAAPAPAAAPAAAAPVAAAPSYAGSGAAGVALQYVGYPYAWGGSSPAGFDCSGFTSFVYRQLGVYLPHSAAMQYSTAIGAPVSMGALAPGDLVFFAGTWGGGISHVAIYVGGGSIVHAMTYGYGVQVSSLYEAYWMAHYYGAIRPYR